MEKKMADNVKIIAEKERVKRYGEEGTKIAENEYLTTQRHPYTGQVRQIVVRYDAKGKRIPPPMITLPNHLRPKNVANIAAAYQNPERFSDPIYAAAEYH